MTLKQFENALNQQIKTQGMTFDPAIDLRNDLVNFYGYTREQVNSMNDSEVFDIIDSISDPDFEESYNTLPIECSNCNHEGLEEREGYIDDYTCLYCPSCKNESQIHYTGMDEIYDEVEFKENMSQDVKVLNENGSFPMDTSQNGSYNKEQFKSFVSDMELIQELGDLTYYRKGSEFYCVMYWNSSKYTIGRYEAHNEESLKVLMSHFFNIN